MIKREDLPVRPVRLLGESLSGYVYRLFNENGHLVPTNVRSALSLLHRFANARGHSIAVARIENLTGAIPTSDRHRWLDVRSWIKQSYGRVRICPECLRCNGAHFSLWDLPLVDVCPIHRSALRDRCDCERKLSWSSLRENWRCRCGIDVSHLAAPRADLGSLVLARVIALCSGDPFWKLKSSQWQLGDGLASLNLSNIYALVDFLDELDRQTYGHVSRKGKTTLCRAAPTSRFLKDRPDELLNHFQCWLERVFDQRTGSPIYVPPKRSATTRLLKSLGDRDASEGKPSKEWADAFDWIRNHVVPTQWPIAVLVRSRDDMQLLGAWMKQFFALTDREQDRNSRSRSKIESAWKGRDERQRRELHLLLECLVGAVMAGKSPSDYRRAARAWPALGEFTGHSGRGWIAHVIEPLSGASLIHLRFLRECCELA
ncbi:tniQ family protein [Paraburkholderia fungorum]|uniref:TniQ family protein n=2 Tax=Paraburkholderia fungorum TaxID=134537 RepID=A0AAU8T3K0_9BURK|nr:tniQ family protein [Paraburkholderia fungorum]